MVIKTKKELESVLFPLRKKGLGLVPTMGALHNGHMALVKKCLLENKTVVVSIFINPTQFNNVEDLKKYPKALDSDIALLRKVSENIIVFAPTTKEMYAANVNAKTYEFDGLDQVMEGAFRDDHFNGVGTIVETLLTLVRPDRAYFGEKDFQQLQVIKKLVQKRNIPVEIIGCPIVRESDGLALSSRNERLSKSLRKEAGLIYKTLLTAKEKFGTESAKYITDWVKNQFKDHSSLKLEYIEISDVDTLTPIHEKQKNRKYRAFIAVYANDVRLIDNIALN